MTKKGIKHLKRKLAKGLYESIFGVENDQEKCQNIAIQYLIDFMLAHSKYIEKDYFAFIDINFLHNWAQDAVKVIVKDQKASIDLNINFQAIFGDTETKGHYIKHDIL